MLRPAYLRGKLTKALPTKDGGILRSVDDARAYMLKLSKAARDEGATDVAVAKISKTAAHPMSVFILASSDQFCTVFPSAGV
jgi:hypothetical protein